MPIHLDNPSSEDGTLLTGKQQLKLGRSAFKRTDGMGTLSTGPSKLRAPRKPTLPIQGPTGSTAVVGAPGRTPASTLGSTRTSRGSTTR